MKHKKQLLVVGLLSMTVIMLSGCQDIMNSFKQFEQSFKGLEMTVRTYDEQSQVMDKVQGKSVKIERDNTFDTDEDSKDSSVIQITVGKNEMHHVGSSMIIEEKGLTNVFDEYADKVDINNTKRSVPMINSMVNDFSNSFKGKDKVILIRSQNGTPLATYAGNKVSMYSTDVPKSTGILIDGKYLFIYRCDYTIYDKALVD
ncbi:MULTISPECIES: DUF5052 family protein [Enterococcaceae]|uniref:DUF5052 family protein n=1 Tax=Enterococcaceae TaxID=81852 RepID=UPI000E4E8507|nr:MULTISPECIES: DUF5052 family protein [Enterococcaceae]MCI0129766.1 DUF5052 family protein [Vagococcus sp. CY53-2]RGI31942.1 DUF5052 family protein [Melissococcus sp. OM08-11BH]UNM90409.1 DUF5052 family protein [Vagococcus sp. CY52-2]